MKQLLLACLVVVHLASPSFGGADDYADQRQSHEDSYRNTLENQALQEYYSKNPSQKPSASPTKKRKRQGAENLHQKTFGQDGDSEVWGTKK